MSLDNDTVYDYDSDDYVDSSAEDDDDVDYALMNVTISKRKNEFEEYYYEILSTEEIAKNMRGIINEANSFVGLPETITRLLLNHFKWDLQKFVNAYYNGDQEQLFEEAHVINPFKSNCTNSASNQPSPNETEDCPVCFAEIPKTMMTGLECGHQFCEDCWKEYLKTKIMDEGIVQTIQCAANSCDTLMDDCHIMRLVKEPKVKEKYQRLISNDFVECNELMKWCPGGCESVIMVQRVESKPVKCKCNFTFCFACGTNWHDPIDCNMLRKWGKHCKGDLESNEWILNNAKNCPRCDAPIQKNEGCNHMTCKNCRYEFCWLCFGPWGRGHSCNRYDEEKEKAKLKKEAKQNELLALQRYTFFSDRYMNHMQSLKFENQLHSNVLEKMKEAQQQYDMTYNEVCFLQKAVDVLISCRRTLMYTYVLAFYLKNNNQTVIFEDNQNDLENAVEVLSGYLERDIAVDNLAQLKPKVQDKFKYCDKRRVVLLEHVREGNDKKWWEFINL